MAVRIRPEAAGDAAAIARPTTSGFAASAHGDGAEAAIIGDLRAAGDLTLSPVAVAAGGIAGHVAVSPVTMPGRGPGWYGPGPLSVRPDRRRRGIGGTLGLAGLSRLRRDGAAGRVLVGHPGFDGRSGVGSVDGLRYAEVPARFVQAFASGAERPGGAVAYRPASCR